jgi:hypothetical protein
VSVLIVLEVTPFQAQVALLDATWQDYPRWESDDEAVAYEAPSLTNPDSPPYPGFAVATQSDIVDGESAPSQSSYGRASDRRGFGASMTACCTSDELASKSETTTTR